MKLIHQNTHIHQSPHSLENSLSSPSLQQQPSHHDLVTDFLLYDEQLLRAQIKSKYKLHLQQLNTHHQQPTSCITLIQSLLHTLLAILEQLWIEIIPQYLRGRYFAEKSPQIMHQHPLLNSGNLSLFLNRMKNDSKHFFIILQQKITLEHSDQQCFDIEDNLFDNSPQSNQKLHYILQCETISLNAQDLTHLEKSTNSPVKFGNFMKSQSKFPLLLVCRYNFLEELKVMGEIELSSVSKESFIELLDEIKKNIFELKNLESECKRQVLMETLHPNRYPQNVV